MAQFVKMTKLLKYFRNSTVALASGLTLALSASAVAVLANDEIITGKRMPVNAMGFMGVDCSWSNSCYDVFTVVNHSEMFDVQTTSVAANVVNHHSVWNGSIEMLPNKSMELVRFPAGHPCCVSFKIQRAVLKATCFRDLGFGFYELHKRYPHPSRCFVSAFSALGADMRFVICFGISPRLASFALSMEQIGSWTEAFNEYWACHDLNVKTIQRSVNI